MKYFIYKDSGLGVLRNLEKQWAEREKGAAGIKTNSWPKKIFMTNEQLEEYIKAIARFNTFEASDPPERWHYRFCPIFIKDKK